MKLIFANAVHTVTIESSEVHLWLWRTEDSALADCAWEIISTDERRRAETFRREIHRIRYLCARIGLRSILASYAGCAPAELVFGTEAFGKPVLQHPAGTQLRFNLAHSAELAVLALRKDIPLGVDLEKIRPVTNLLQLAERFFSSREAEILRQCDPEKQLQIFFRLWTCKESILKGLGLGLSFPLHAVEIPPVEGQRTVSTDCVDGVIDFDHTMETLLVVRISAERLQKDRLPRVQAGNWWVWECLLDGACFLAVASCESWKTTRLRVWRPGECQPGNKPHL